MSILIEETEDKVMNENENRRTRCIVRGLTDRKAGKQENRLPEVAAVLISIGDVLPIIYWSIHAHYFFYYPDTVIANACHMPATRISSSLCIFIVRQKQNIQDRNIRMLLEVV